MGGIGFATCWIAHKIAYAQTSGRFKIFWKVFEAPSVDIGLYLKHLMIPHHCVRVGTRSCYRIGYRTCRIECCPYCLRSLAIISLPKEEEEKFARLIGRKLHCLGPRATAF